MGVVFRRCSGIGLKISWHLLCLSLLLLLNLFLPVWCLVIHDFLTINCNICTSLAPRARERDESYHLMCPGVRCIMPVSADSVLASLQVSQLEEQRNKTTLFSQRVWPKPFLMCFKGWASRSRYNSVGWRGRCLRLRVKMPDSKKPRESLSTQNT